jgi:hypothetical protein
MLKLMFRKPQQSPSDIEELNEANIALRVRMDKILHSEKPKKLEAAHRFAVQLTRTRATATA